ncbi:MAG: sigma-70 family RNA polymerase sigma factor [Nanoarchaeota archaeon]|nr:sigma-70 family RNA polymerase sigma factor [Nanoarchaeota archaeon]
MSDELAKYFVNNIRQLRTICRRVNNKRLGLDEFEDCMQEIWLNAKNSNSYNPGYDHGKEIDPDTRMRLYIVTAFDNKVKDFLRRKSGKVSQINMTDIVSSLGEEVNASDFYSNLAVDETRPYDEIEKYESSLPVRKALTHLSKKHREIIVLAYYQKFTYQQISDTLGVPAGTVKSRLHTAMGKLENLLFFADVDLSS